MKKKSITISNIAKWNDGGFTSVRIIESKVSYISFVQDLINLL
jgi:hypothetical protein